MAKIYYDGDASLEPLAGKTVAIVGYGNQGRAQTLNLCDSGVEVVVGNVDDDYAAHARADGFAPIAIDEAVARADVVLFLVPDEVQPEVYERSVGPNLDDGDVLCFAHGYNIAFGHIRPRSEVDVVMVAPRMIGAGVRDKFVSGDGFPSLVGVHQDATGRAHGRMLAIARAI